MKNTLLFIYSTNILVCLLTVNMKNFLTPKNPKMCDPTLVTVWKMQRHYSQSSRENATPSSGTSPLASYKEVPPSPGADGSSVEKALNIKRLFGEFHNRPEWCSGKVRVFFKVLSRRSFQKSRRLWVRRTHMMGLSASFLGGSGGFLPRKIFDN